MDKFYEEVKVGEVCEFKIPTLEKKHPYLDDRILYPGMNIDEAIEVKTPLVVHVIKMVAMGTTPGFLIESELECKFAVEGEEVLIKVPCIKSPRMVKVHAINMMEDIYGVYADIVEEGIVIKDYFENFKGIEPFDMTHVVMSNFPGYLIFERELEKHGDTIYTNSMLLIDAARINNAKHILPKYLEFKVGEEVVKVLYCTKKQLPDLNYQIERGDIVLTDSDRNLIEESGYDISMVGHHLKDTDYICVFDDNSLIWELIER